ncbi:MAG: hypothetical protein QF541_20650, partial [Lentisphaeria bacterium]|nr:hypothetical protein [Lentisphaeria bacterium]
MCGIAGLIALDDRAVDGAARHLQVMNDLLSHRGPDDEGVWLHDNGHVGLARSAARAVHEGSVLDDEVVGHEPPLRRVASRILCVRVRGEAEA